MLDSNSDRQLSRQEFVGAMKNKSSHIGLDAEELVALFEHLDKNRDGKIGLADFLETFSAINTQDHIRKIKDAAQAHRDGSDGFFRDHCLEDRSKQSMTKADFIQLARKLFANMSSQEV